MTLIAGVSEMMLLDSGSTEKISEFLVGTLKHFQLFHKLIATQLLSKSITSSNPLFYTIITNDQPNHT